MTSITKNTPNKVCFNFSNLSESIPIGEECKTIQDYTLRFCQSGKSCEIVGLKGKKNGCTLCFEFLEGCENGISLKLGNHTAQLINASDEVIGTQVVWVQKRLLTKTFHY